MKAPYGGHPPFEKSSDTSRIAAASIAGEALTLRTRVRRFIREQKRHGATDDEVEEALEMRHQTASARRRELVLKGYVVDSGRRRTTRSGRLATIWVHWKFSDE